MTIRLSGLLLVALLGGCASVDIDESIQHTNEQAADFTGGQLQLAQTDDQRSTMQARADELLADPLGQDEAVRVALINSPRMQMLIAQYWSEAAEAAENGRIANPVFAFERIRLGGELEIARALSFGLVDVLTYPQRYSRAQRALASAQLGLTATVVEEVTEVRQAWVEAVGASERLEYAYQVFESAEASAELAQRMRAAGNFSELARARQQVFYSDAVTRLASARHQAIAAREALVQRLGLTEEQADRLVLPKRLPDIPQAPVQANTLENEALQKRLDVQIAKAGFEAAAEAQGLTLLTSFTDIEVAALRETVFEDGDRESAWGYEFELTLPIFNWGGMQREAMNARTLAAANSLEATLRSIGSDLREQYSAYRTAYDVARHYRTEVIPLRQKIMEESVLRYNGMIIGVFELLADHRQQVASVIGAIDATQNFWLADAALEATLIGRPTNLNTSLSIESNPAGGGDEAH
ncbi:TolC family protein [Allohahella marinimesophila]|uniref:TolC family protein n=1 Tax=Allohahella marinimesophila TaxID=1054972 RepID=A0ABP7NHI1_9GAMM